MNGVGRVAIAAVAFASLPLLLWFGHAHSNTLYSSRLAWVRVWVQYSQKSAPDQQQQLLDFTTQRRWQDSGVKVYVYDLPPQYNSDLRHTYQCELTLGMATVEIWLHEALLNSTALRTLDPDKADFFFVPLYSECLAEVRSRPAALPVGEATGTRSESQNETAWKDWQKLEEGWQSYKQTDSPEWFRSAVKHIWNSHPYFNHTAGRDHLFVFPYGHGPLRFWGWERHIQRSIFLTTAGPIFSPDVLTQEYARTWKDIMIPLYHKYPDGTGRERRSGRQILAFFKGAMDHKRAGVDKPQVRDMLVEALRGQPDVYANEAPSKHTQNNETALDHSTEPTYWEHLLNSVFCLAPEGYHPNSCRPFESLAAGCIPVILADQFELPFEDFFDWREFSIKVPESDTPDLMRILRGIPKEVIEAKRDAMDRVWRAFQYPTPSRPGDALHYISLQLARRKRVFKNSAKTSWIHPGFERRQNASAGLEKKQRVEGGV